MPEKRGKRPKRDRDPFADKRDVDILQLFHCWGFCTYRPIAIFLGLTYSHCTKRVRRLARLGYLVDLGVLRKHGSAPGYGRYYRPKIIDKPPAPGFVLRHAGMTFPDFSDRQFTSGIYAPRHNFNTLLAAEWIAYSVRLGGQDCRIVPEFILRYQRGWFGSGLPPRHPNPVLAMVPDFIVETDGGAFHVEVELTPKKTTTYETLLTRLQPRNREVLYVTLDAQAGEIVRRRLSKAGYHTTVITLWDSDALGRFLARFSPSPDTRRRE